MLPAPSIRPMLCGGTTIPRDPRGWVVEPKWDGVRAIVTIGATGTTATGAEVRIASRNDNDITSSYPELAGGPAKLGGRPVVLDAEIISVGPSGGPDFGLLQRRMHVKRPSASLVDEVPVSVVLFDLLWADGELLIERPYSERRDRLVALDVHTAPWMTSPVLDIELGGDLLPTGRELGLEGFVAKRVDSPYLPGRRSDAWVKLKCGHRREFVVAGWVPGRGGRTGELGSLALGVHDGPGGPLRFVGLAGSGLTGADVSAFRRALDHLGRDTSPFSGFTAPGVRFLEPVLVAEVTFTEVTRAGTLRHPVLAGFRTDINASEVVVDAELRAAGFVG